MGGSSASAIWGRYQRCGPIHCNGEARSLQTGSVSTRAPSISIRLAAWPSQVTRRPDAGGVAKRAGSIGATGIGCRGLASSLA